jgi:hypothetical protein
MMAEALLWHQRFFANERQLNNLLEGIAILLREAPVHFDLVLANLLQISALKFLTSNLLERHEGFRNMRSTPAGIKFADLFRELSGMGIAYSIFSFPNEKYPDVGAVLEAIPDMVKFIDIANDVLS